MKKLHKVEQGKMLCGVCTGIAAYFDIDPTLVRLGWVLFSLLGGLTASMLLGGQVYTVEYLPHPELRFVALSPDFPLSTHEARRVLPSMVAHSTGMSA